MTRATIFEEHSAVLAHWFANGVRDATLLYLDAHLDLQFVSPERIARLAACADGQQMAQLESPHCLSPERGACYGIEDFLYPAAQLGMLRRVVWVAPPHVFKGGMANALRSLLQMEGVSIVDLESFQVLPGGAIEGRLLGLQLTICELGQLPALAGPLLVDIDADYFVKVPEDEVWTAPAAVVAALRKAAGDAADLTIARSVSSGFMPLHYGCIADLLAALWEHRAADAAHWQSALAQTPPTEDGTGADLLRRLGQVRARRQRIDLAGVLALQREVAAAPLDQEQQAIAWISLGRLFTAFGRLEEAIACDRTSRDASAGHPELALEIAKLHLARGDHGAAIPLLERAAADDETRAGAWLLLAECAHARGEHAQARENGLLAHHAAPAWPLVPQRLAAFAAARGDTAEAAAMLARHADLERRIRVLAQRLA
jgi:tetratricopeptide (TPR) repeat protein